MRPTRRELLRSVAASAGAVGLAGCLGGGEPADSPTDSPTPTDEGMDTTQTPTATPGTATVQLAEHPDHGEILVGPEGLTLYMFDSDTEGEAASTCYGDCASAWPPLTVEGMPTKGEGVAAALDTFERDGGETQVMAGGWPLYYFANDGAPGDANGQGIGDVWWVLDPDGAPVKPSKRDGGY